MDIQIYLDGRYIGSWRYVNIEDNIIELQEERGIEVDYDDTVIRCGCLDLTTIKQGVIKNEYK